MVGQLIEGHPPALLDRDEELADSLGIIPLFFGEADPDGKPPVSLEELRGSTAPDRRLYDLLYVGYVDAVRAVAFRSKSIWR